MGRAPREHPVRGAPAILPCGRQCHGRLVPAIAPEVRTALVGLARPPQLLAAASLAVVFGLLAGRHSHSVVEWLAVAPLLAVLAAVVVVDVMARVIPDVIMLPGLAYALVWASAAPGAPGALNAVVGALCGAGVVLAMALATRGGVGGGDIKLMAMLGAAVGWKVALVVVALSQIFGAVVALGMLAARRARGRSGVPVGAVMALLGALVLIVRH